MPDSFVITLQYVEAGGWKFNILVEGELQRTGVMSNPMEALAFCGNWIADHVSQYGLGYAGEAKWVSAEGSQL